MIVPTLPLDANFGGSRKPTQGSTHVVLMNDDEFGDLTNCSKLKHYLKYGILSRQVALPQVLNTE